ncbi:MAG: S-layer homology domain-containing protein, partial [Syntrophomonadaceae bacterium]
QDMYSRYDFNLPRIVNGQVAGSRLRSGIELKMEMSPRIERLVVPKFRDVAGHWAQDDIEKLYSLDVFEGAPSFFAPDAPMTRVEFTRAIVKGANMRPSLAEQPRQTARSRTRTVEVSPFRDVLVTSPDYQYIKDGVERGIISGVSEDLFGPEQSLTRAQAITIMVRALGFENMAPTPGFQTSFADDYFIPNWAIDSVYVAREIGLISGDASNRVNPNQVLTRGEASSMLVRFLNFLEQDLQRDYREDLVLF